MKIEFKCFDCHESFAVSLQNLARKESLACPNCEKPFPQSNFEALKKLHSIFMAAAEGLIESDKEGICQQHWDFKIIQ